MKFCPNCGHELPTGTKFCPACGTPIPQPAPASETATAQPQDPVPPTARVTTQANDVEAQPQLGFVGSVQYVLKHAFEFNGNVPESRKSVFWWAYLAYCIVVVIAELFGTIGVVLNLVLAILLVAATMRRLAYLGRNDQLGWLLMIPLVNLYIFYLMLLDRKGA